MKKGISLLLILCLLLPGAIALAEKTITVNGSGEIRISADTAVISLGVSARDPDVLTAQQKVNAAIAAIRQALMDQGVKEENINTEYISIYALYDYTNDREQLTAYNASSNLAVTVTDMDSVGALIDLAFASGANTLGSITFDASNTEEAKAEAMKAAVENAKKKAEILAEASGLKITGVRTITEDGFYSYANSAGNARYKDMGAGAEGSADTVVQAAKLILSASVTVIFEAE
ncbi:MAG: SIMPL domain-containing protein [Clostridia bacterium]|nr:SIMPL domain-containing protein [Clostridia bacterium]